MYHRATESMRKYLRGPIIEGQILDYSEYLALSSRPYFLFFMWKIFFHCHYFGMSMDSGAFR
jgi:hypothetical protein